VIDLHCHVLPGIDDGPENIEESVVLAREAARAGTRVLVATPHVSSRYRNDPERIARLVGELNERLISEAIELLVRPGAEIALAHARSSDLAELGRLTLGGGPWLLVEPPFSPAATGIETMLRDLLRSGARIVLAHPERSPAFQRDPRLLRSLVADGILNSITAGSLTGRFGDGVRRFALRLLREGLVHNVASDAHDRYSRPPGIAAELDQAGAGALADWLTRQVPQAILDGTEIPSRPDVALGEISLSRAWWRRLAGQSVTSRRTS
jgi:protein-tyrosine phosphatase